MSEAYCLIPFSLWLIYIGYIGAYDQDAAWEWQKAANARRGVVSQRTESWEINSEITGYILMVLGALILLGGIGSIL